MIVGYARTSTADQVAGLDGQRRELQAAGCEKIFAEQVSSVADRPQLAACLTFLREGDSLVVTKPDRLARNVAALLGMVEDFERRGVGLRIMSMGGTELDTRQPTAKLLLTMLGAIAAFERELMLERQREGIAKAKAEGKYKGRAPTARNQSDEIRRLRASGLGASAIADQLGIGRTSVYRVIDESGAAAD